MKILVIGSTGPQGREFVAQALAAGHAVRAFARNPAALQPAPGLEVLRGDVFDQHSLDAAARGQDAAVSMLGVSFAAARRPTNVFSQGTRNLIAALKAAGVRRLIVQSSFGVGDSRRDAGLLERVFYALCHANLMLAAGNPEAGVRSHCRINHAPSNCDGAYQEVGRH